MPLQRSAWGHRAACRAAVAMPTNAGVNGLAAAAKHFGMLLSGEIVSPDEWSREAERVVAEVIDWGNRIEKALSPRGTTSVAAVGP